MRKRGISVTRKAAESPTFGKVLLLFFKDGGKIKCVMVFGRKLRASEIISIWKQHHSIKCFWRRLKTDLQIHKVRMRDREGVCAMIYTDPHKEWTYRNCRGYNIK